MDTRIHSDKITDAQEKFAEEIREAAQATGTILEENADELARTAQQFNAAFQAAGELAQVAYESAREQVAIGAKATDEAIRKHPYQAVGIAIGVGFLIGYLIKRK